MSLRDLLKKGWAATVATKTDATVATVQSSTTLSVAKVASVAVAHPKNVSAANNDALDLDEALFQLCLDERVSVAEVKSSLSKQDIIEWENGNLSTAALKVYIELNFDLKEIRQGHLPETYVYRANCKFCGPVWLNRSKLEVTGCIWCGNRIKGRFIPRPSFVKCADCVEFKRINHPNLGHCNVGQKEDLAGLWDNTLRDCERFKASN